ncbi:MAG: carboxylating nicotinate-nucleotide diphosphorylase [Acidobacteria bacterium]|nr:carboxylating nicotinate-nucleotide diphosphorylase [Acidobacteriota bacterium]
MTIAPLPPILYEDLIRSALREDLGRAGDLTTDSVVPVEAEAEAAIVARREGRVAGAEVAARVFRILDPAVETDILVDDGVDAASGDPLVRLCGPARAILTAERTALNILGRLCGIATLTRAFVRAVEGTGAQVVCTRKTTPGLRALEKYAVRCGGGASHRFGLDDAVLIKDNHLAVAGGIRRAVERARAGVGHMVKIELEVDTLAQLEEGLAVGVDAVLLDNMDPEILRKAVTLVDGRCLTEASGGIDLETAAAVAATGVDLLSVGALTHSAQWLDVSLEVVTGED